MFIGTSVVEMRGSRTGVFVGAGISESHASWVSNIDEVSGYEMIGCEHTMFANRLSHYFDLKGNLLNDECEPNVREFVKAK